MEISTKEDLLNCVREFTEDTVVYTSISTEMAHIYKLAITLHVRICRFFTPALTAP